MGALLELQDVSFTYKQSSKKALERVSLEIKKGEFVGICGASGAGKTTLCYCLAGVIPHAVEGELSGKILIKGKDTKELSLKEILKTVGICLQDAESQLFMTDVEKEVAFQLENFAYPREEIQKRVDEALKITRLEGYRKRHPFFLSGGEKQRVVIATILAFRPEVLVLDETLSDLDPLGVEEVMEVVARLKKEGKTIVMVDHNIEILAEFADKIVVISEGKIVAMGSPDEVLSQVDFLKKHGLDPPAVAQIAYNLLKAGVRLPKIPVRFEEGVELFTKLIKAKK